MKGTFFQKSGLEFLIRTERESWHQGETIEGVLTVKSHLKEPVSMDQIHVHLARATLKKVRDKVPEAFAILASEGSQKAQTIPPGGSADFNWSFALDRNAFITDTVTSLFLVYGQGDAHTQLGQLQLQVEPDPLIIEFLKRLQITYRFVIKSRKASVRKTVEVKLDPPDSRSFSSVEQLGMSFRFEGEDLEVGYEFVIKKLEPTATGAATVKTKQAHEEVFTPAQYRLQSGRIDLEGLEARIGAVISQVENKHAF